MGKLILNKTYGIAPNNVLNDVELSFKAKGLYTYIQSKPDGWDFSVERIALQSKDGRESVAAGLKELENAGYLLRTPSINDKGQFSGYDYTLYEQAQTVSGESNHDLTVDGKPVDGKAVGLSNKEYSKKDYSKKEKERESGNFEKKSTETLPFENVGHPEKGFILNDLRNIWMQMHPTYEKMADPKFDNPALREIAEKITGTPHIHANRQKTIDKFKTFCKAALSEEFWRKKPLKSFSNNIQTFLPLIEAIESGKSLMDFKSEKVQVAVFPEKINLDTRGLHKINGGQPIRL
jgi:hypothetical protein